MFVLTLRRELVPQISVVIFVKKNILLVFFTKYIHSKEANTVFVKLEKNVVLMPTVKFTRKDQT